MSEPITHLVIARADPEGANAQAKIGHTKEPTPEILRQYEDHIAALYVQGFGRMPDRVGVAVLPWVEELDGDDDEQARAAGETP